MNVLHVVSTYQRRGAEIFAADIVRMLNSEGVRQSVAVLRSTDGPAVTYEAPTTVLEAPDRRRGLPIDLRSVKSLRQLIRQSDPDVIQTHGGEPLFYSISASRGGRTPVVYRRIGSAHRLISTGVRRLIYGSLMRRAAVVVAVSEAVREETIRTFRLDPARVIAIPNGIDPRRLRPVRGRDATRRELGVPSSARVILSLGALTWEKDPLAHIGATAPVLEELRDAVHIVVGDGELRRDVEEEVRRRRLPDRVLLLGTRDEIGDLLSASDVLLLASRTEGMPGTAIEAAMMGIPVVAYDLGGIPEVIQHGATGLLAPAGRVDSLSSALSELLKDDTRRKRMGEAARERSLQAFDVRAIGPRYLRIYRALTKTNGIMNSLRDGEPDPADGERGMLERRTLK
jgi:glycosyltransferase involved in cell wall biosynthesis